MEKRKKLYILFVILLGMGFAGIRQSLAQSEGGLNIDDIQIQPLNDRLKADIYFRLDPIFFDESEPSTEATLTLQNQPSTTYPVLIQPSLSPYYVVFILGNGVTTQDSFFQVQDFANELISSAPGAPQFAVIEYSNFVGRVREDFNPVKNEIISNINQIEPSDRESLCLLDAVNDGINLLNSELINNPEFPKAVVVLGNEGEIQSQFKANGCNADRQSVTAYSNESNVTLHTVNFAPNSGSDSDPMKLLSDFTQGESLNSGSSQFSTNQSTALLDNLSQQWVATVDLFPTAGEQLATLTLDVSDIPAVTSFQFTSPQLFEKPLGAPEITLASFRYDENEDVYIVEVNIDNLKVQDGNLRFQLWSQATNVAIYEQTILGLDASKFYIIETDQLVPGQDYTLQIIPLNSGNQPLRDDENNVVIIENPFTYLPKIVPPPFISVASIVPNSEEGFATVTFETANIEPESVLNGYYNNAQNTKEGDFGPFPISPTGVMTAPLPLDEFKTDAPLDYTLILNVTNPDTQSTTTEFEFSYLPKQPPGFFARTWWIFALILAGIAGTSGYFYYSQRNKKKEYDMQEILGGGPPPKVKKPQKKEKSDSAVRKLVKRARTPLPSEKKSDPGRRPIKQRLDKHKVKNQNIFVKIVKSNNNDLIDKKYLITDLPFTLGRKYFQNDPLISGSHLEIGHDANGLYIKDLGSSNHTFVGDSGGKQLLPNEPFYDIKTSPPTKIRLGKRTTIILQFDKDAFSRKSR